MRLAPFAMAALLVATPGNAESIAGAGATFPAPLYQRWIETFLGNRANDHISYDAVGSGQGIGRLLDGRADFAGSDVCDTTLVKREPAASTPPNILCIPVAAGAVVPIFNLAGVTRDLRLTPELLAGIYLGEITKWNDPAIRAVNRGVSLPNRAITVVHRTDASGTTYTFSDYLSLSSEQWRTRIGKGLTLEWPSGKGAETNDGVAQIVQQMDGAIGYVEFVYAVEHHLGVISLRNRAGHFVRADLETVGAAAVGANGDPSLSRDASITDSSGVNAYPLSTFTYVLLLKDTPKDAKRKLLRDFLEWVLDSGQRQAPGLGYIAVPAALTAEAHEALKMMQ